MREDINIKDKKIIVIVLLIILCISVFGGNKIFNKKIRNNNQNNIRNKEVPKEQFAMYIKNENGNYDKYEGNEFPDGYKINLEKSSCEDANGNIVNGAISTTNGKPTITSNKTIYCIFYMDEKGLTGSDIATKPDIPNINKTEVMEDELEYRYQGSAEEVNNNYICFGTKDKDECINNEDRFMYRIIGVTKNKKQFKVIKKTALEEGYYWHNDYTTDITWPESDLYKGLNGISGGTYSNLFIGNTKYIPNNDWLNKIDSVDWKYGDVAILSPTEMLQTEQGWTDIINAKIGLMYASDFSFSLTKEGNKCASESCKTSWLHISNNDSTPPTSYAEWIISRNGYWNSGYFGYTIINSGFIATAYAGSSELTQRHTIRPVFYLIPEIELSGSGSQSDPFIITN